MYDMKARNIAYEIILGLGANDSEANIEYATRRIQKLERDVRDDHENWFAEPYQNSNLPL